MNSPPHEGRSQDRGSGHLSLGRVSGSLRGTMDMDPGISLFAWRHRCDRHALALVMLSAVA